MLLPHMNGRLYGILGLGKSGRSVFNSLKASGANICVWDDDGAKLAAIKREYNTLTMFPPERWDWGRMAALVLSPGIPHTHPVVAMARKRHTRIINDVELLAQANTDVAFIGITGTNGKSTTTTLIGHILVACGKHVEVGGNLGTPALDLKPLVQGDVYVLELSSYQLEAVRSLHAHVAVWLNISPDHLDHHGSMDAYIKAKRHIFDRQKPEDIAVIGIDDATSEAVCRTLIDGKHQRVIPISGRQNVTRGVYVREGILTNSITNQTADLRDITSLRGEHNGQNAAAAYAACFAMDCGHEEIIAAMRTYVGLPHRMQYLGEINGVTFVNDSKATNADAAEKALRTYDNIYWIAGGIAKEGGIESLAPYFPKIRHAYLIGEAAESFAKTLDGQVTYSQLKTLDAAFHAAVTDAQTAGNGVVLLAPACASFDQFANFEKRGEAFVTLVDAWKEAV